jgi:hypothetical protein
LVRSSPGCPAGCLREEGKPQLQNESKPGRTGSPGLVAQGHEDFRLPVGNELDKIMRYEAHLSRQLYQGKHEVEDLQKQRRGEATPLARLDVQGAPEQSERAPESGVYELKPITPLNP